MAKKKTKEIDPGILFTQEEFEIKDVLAFKASVCSGFKLRKQLQKVTDSFDENKPGRLGSKYKASMRKGIACWILNNTAEALNCLKKAWRSKTTDFFLALCYLETGKYDSAYKLLEPLYRENHHEAPVLFAFVEAKIRKGLYEEALGLLQKSKKDFRNEPEIYYYTGWCLEGLGQYSEMIKEYNTALKNNSNHAPTLFRLAYNLERAGEDEQAIELYEKLKKIRPLYINAMVNLGVLYEDKGDYQSATGCYKLILDYYPNHPRAQLYLKDTVASLGMYYDEDQKRREEQLKRLMNTPISDFHLSVRSRAALSGLKLASLGDLADKTENELLKLDNFGMTSLTEIKELLARKGLSLAQEQIIDASPESWERHPSISESSKATDVLNRSLFTFEWSSRSRKCLENLKIYTISDIVNKTERELMNTPNFGRTSLNEIKQRLGSLGLTLKPDVG